VNSSSVNGVCACACMYACVRVRVCAALGARRASTTSTSRCRERAIADTCPHKNIQAKCHACRGGIRRKHP